MRHRRLLYLRAIAISLCLLVISPFPSLSYSSQSRLSSDSLFNSYVQQDGVDESGAHAIKQTDSPLNIYEMSDEEVNPIPAQGVLDPVTIEQRGYTHTGNITARTDTLVNTQQSLPIDTSHDWVGSQVEVDVWDLERLYVVNGTFDDGIFGYTVDPNGTISNCPFGWGAISTDGDPSLEQVQQVYYEESGERYIATQNKARLTNLGQKEYTHYTGTSVLWNQTFQNTPYTDQFILSFSYSLLQGPLNSIFSGKYSLKVYIDGVAVHSINLPTLSNRGTWFDTETIPVTIAAPMGATTFMIGLIVDTTFVAGANEDYDGDGFADGVINTQYITVLLDDVLLTSASSPDCEEVDLQFSINSIATPISGTSGSGSGLLVNESYWTASPLSVVITANTSISLDYNARLLNHRFLNSYPTTNTVKTGVAYTIPSNHSSSLEMFTYLGFIGLYDELILRIYHPEDWQNFTILDPFLTDVTMNCTLESMSLDIPTDLLSRLGWWKILCESPNYAADAVIERYDSGTSGWLIDTIFHTSEEARLSISIGSNGQIPLLSDAVNFTWALPNCSIYHQSTIISGLIGSAVSSSITFGSINTTAGVWGVIYHWTNGSELAYSCVRFALHHQAALQVVFSDNLETVVGQPVTVVLRFYDIENSLYLLNNGAEVIGTWSAGVVEFEPNIVKNWWQADFDTALVGAGNFEVSIASAAPYFETTPLIITIKSHYLTSLNPPTGPLLPLIYGRGYSFDYFYSIDYNGSGVDGAVVEVTEEGSEWTEITNIGGGHYNLSITPLGLQDYNLRITFSKVGYQNQSHVLSFLVNRVPIEVNLLTSLRGPEYQPLTVEVEVVEVDTDRPVTDANVSLSVAPQFGLPYTTLLMVEGSPGIYSAVIVMPEAGDLVFNVVIIVEKENYELSQNFMSTLIPTFDANARLFNTVIQYSSQIIILAGALFAIVAGQKVYSRKRQKKHALARDIKRRFSDANNLLGVIVLHKLSGVPIYSKILKGGFEEGMLSAFIAAIMHFRVEFDKQREKDEYVIIPISDFIRAVSTQSLICAFITITSTSKDQEEKMINYARAIGMMFDEALSERPTQVADVKVIETFEWMFDDFVDGDLLRPYQIGEKKLPKKLNCISDIVNKTDGVDSFLLVNLIRLLESCGIDEDDANLLVMNAIEQEYIVPIYKKNNSRPKIVDE